MIQPQWPGLGTSSLPQPFPGNSYGIQSSPASFVDAGDGVTSGWWNGVGANAAGVGATNTSSLLGMLQSLVGMLGQLVGSMMNGSGAGSGAAASPWLTGAQNPWTASRGNPEHIDCGVPGSNGGTCESGEQRFSNVAISSTGDPHIAETGVRRTAGGDVSVDEHYDSMASHRDLVDAESVAGGYRVSTSVTQPNARGVTWNASASVSANGGRDAITMNRDGLFAISSDGQTESLARGQSLTLAGGETVTENNDGSLQIAGSNRRGGTIDTTLRAADGGVDVNVHGTNITLGGDVVAHDSGSSWEPPVRRLPVRDAEALNEAAT